MYQGRYYLYSIFSLFMFFFYPNPITAKPIVNISSLIPSTVQESIISGHLSDKNGLPIPGVTIINSGKKKGTITDIDGNFAVQASPNDILVFSALGFISQTVVIDEKKACRVLHR